MSKKNVLYAGVLVIVLAVFGAIWFLAKPETTFGEKELLIKVVHGDQTTVEFPVTTDAEYLDEVLVGNGIVEDNQGAYGLYVLTVDGETADESNQEWWSITRNGEALMTGASETPVADGEQYELTLTVGYGF